MLVTATPSILCDSLPITDTREKPHHTIFVFVISSGTSSSCSPMAAGLLPLDTAGSQAAALILGVGFQEGLRYGCFLLHRQALPLTSTA